MKRITSLLAWAVVVLTPPSASQAITNTAIAASGTNIILSWPSYGYESYLIQYRQTLNLTDSWLQVVNAYPANSTNRTTYTLYGLVPKQAVKSGGKSQSLALKSGSAILTSAIATTPGLLVIPVDGSGPSLPLAIFPPGTDLSGYLILDPTTGETVRGAEDSTQDESPLSAGLSAWQTAVNNSASSAKSMGRFFRLWEPS